MRQIRFFLCWLEVLCCMSVHAQNMTDTLLTGRHVYDMAMEYSRNGMPMETLQALYQAWVMGEQNVVDSFICKSDKAQTVRELLKSVDSSSSQLIASIESKGADASLEEQYILCFADTRHTGKMLALMKDYAEEGITHYMVYKMPQLPDGTDVGYSGRFKALKASVEAGCNLGAAELGYYYYNGVAIQQDVQQGAKWLLHAYRTGCLSTNSEVDALLSLLDEQPQYDQDGSIRDVLNRMKIIDLDHWMGIMHRLLLVP